MNKYLFLFIFNLTTIITHAQRIENLAFEGAGIRGLAYAGVIQALEEKKLLPNVKRIVGTSAGAITALLVSIGYNSTEIEKIISTTNFAKFNDGGFPILGGIKHLRKNYGWYKGNKFEKWLGKLVAAKTGNAQITFAQIAQQYKALYITGTSLNTQTAITFSAENYPQMPVVNAIRISMSIPLYFNAVIMDMQGNIYKKIPKNLDYHIMIDGGFMQNFPISVLDSTKYFDNTIANKAAPNPYTIGFRVDTKEQIAIDSTNTNHPLAAKKINNIGSYLNAFLVLLTERLNRQQLQPHHWQRTVSINDANISPKIKALPLSDKNELIINGYAATIMYLKKLVCNF